MGAYTSRAICALRRAVEAAQLCGDERVRPAHVLLGVLKTNGGATDVLAELGVDATRICDEIHNAGALPPRSDAFRPRSEGQDERSVRKRMEEFAAWNVRTTMEWLEARKRRVRFDASARQVMEAANADASALAHDRVGTEHLLLGVLGLDARLAKHALADADVLLVDVRDRIRALPTVENGWEERSK